MWSRRSWIGLQDTMLAFGRGMAFVGRQVRLSVPADLSDEVDEFYVDLLVFSTDQVRYVVVELKIGRFEPAHVGQLGTYVAIVDDQYRRPEIHAPTLGLLLCTGKSGPTVRYALASSSTERGGTHATRADGIERVRRRLDPECVLNRRPRASC